MLFFFSFFFLFFFFFLFLSLCFPRFFRPSLEEEEEDEEDEALEELEEEEEELDRGLLRALCLLLSSAAEEVVPALRPWDLEAEQLLRASLLLFFLLFSDPRPRDRLRLLERLREPTGAMAPRAETPQQPHDPQPPRILRCGPFKGPPRRDTPRLRRPPAPRGTAATFARQVRSQSLPTRSYPPPARPPP